MTEMVYGAMPSRVREPVIPRWWRTIDKWTLTSCMALFGIGLLLGLAASVPLASRNGLEPYFYVKKEAIFGGFSMVVMICVSMMSPTLIRRLGIIGFGFAVLALMALPFIGEDHGKGAVRWLSIGGFSLQPSEFLKPFFIIVTAWLMAAAQDLNGPPGKLLSMIITVILAGFLVMQPDFGQTMLILFGWGVVYFVAGAPMVLIIGVVGAVGMAGFSAYNLSEHFARRIDGFLNPDIDPRSQIGYAVNAIQEGGFFGVGLGEGQVKWISGWFV